jgi:hypothetical protein
MISGLVEFEYWFGLIPGIDTQLKNLASSLAHAVLCDLSDFNGVGHDVCEPNCGADGTQFKGIFPWSLAMLSNMVERDDPSFAEAILRNADSIWQRDRWDPEFDYAETDLTECCLVKGQWTLWEDNWLSQVLVGVEHSAAVLLS